MNIARDETFRHSTTADILMALPIKEALKESREANCLAYATVFFERAKEAEVDGDNEVAKAWNLLGHLCQMTLMASEPDEPFHPFWEDAGGWRTPVPSDMDEVSADAVRQLGFAVSDWELRSRLLDAIWIRPRDPEAAREAVRGYVKAANALLHSEHWTEYADRVERAARLASQLRDKDLVDDVLKEIENRVVEPDGNDSPNLICHLMKILLCFKRGDPKSMRDIAAKGAQLAEGKGDFERARNWHNLVGMWCRLNKDDEGVKAAQIANAASLLKLADQHSKPGEESVKAHYLEKAHEAYRKIPGMSQKAEEVYTLLRESQQRAVQYLDRIMIEIPNVPELTKDALDRVAGKSKREALLALATVVPVSNFDQHTENAREMLKEYPLQGLFGGRNVDHSGRVVARMRSASTDDENEFEKALWERVVQKVRHRYSMIAPSRIIPAMNQLNFDHAFSLEDMVDLVVDNPFVPPGHEELFARGFLAGLRWNLAESLSILVPQLENSLRHVLARAGHEVTKQDRRGIQDFFKMGTILKDCRKDLETMMGSDIVKEMKVLFVDPNGANLRNRIAHGLMWHDQFGQPESIYAWWFMLHLAICHVHARFLGNDGSEGDAADRSKAGG